MALSGSFGTDFGGGYRLQLEWSATQNISNNTSTIMTRLYLISKGSSWTINSSASKYVELNINDGSDHYSSKSEGGLASLGGNQKKEIFWHSFTVGHNSNGTKSVYLAGRFDVNVTISGSYVGRLDTSQTVTLDTIPRNSQITTQPDITAGRPHSFTLERYSSEFDHGVEFFVAGQFIKRLDGVGTSGTFNFSKDEVYIMYQKLQANGYNPVSCAIRVFTYRYGTQIGSYVERGGTCYNWGGGYASFAGVNNYGDSISVTINNGHPDMRYNTNFTLNGVSIKNQNDMTQGVTNVSFSAEKQAMLNATPTVTGAMGRATVTTYWYKSDGVTKIQVANPIYSDFWANGGNALVDPTFNPTITYADTNNDPAKGNTLAVTGNNQYIIQDMSLVTVTLAGATKATTTNGTTIKEYVVSLGGKQVTQAHTAGTTDITFVIGSVSSTTNLTIEIKAIDNRGRYKSAYKTVTIVPYSKPTLVANVTRVNNFENSTEITINGTISPLVVNSSAKNILSSLKYRSKTTVGGSWSAYSEIKTTAVITGSNFSHPKITNTYDNSYAYSFEILVQDIFGATSQMQVNRTIEKGKPLFFIDYEKSTLGVGKFPENANNGMEIVGRLEADGITSKMGVFQIGSLTRANHGNGATEFAYNELTTDLNILGRNWGNNTTHDINMRVSGRIYAKEIYAWNNGGIWFDGWGNIKGTNMANTAGNTWSIKDGDDRNRFLTYIGKGSTGSTEISSYTNGIDFFHDNYKALMVYTSNYGVNRILQFGNGNGGIFKWQQLALNSEGRFEFRKSDDSDWAKLSGTWVDPSSRKYKKNIETYEESAIDIIMNATPVTYHFKSQADEEKKMIGLIAEDAPHIIQADEEGTGINTYGMITVSWKGIQENTLEIRQNTESINQLTKTVKRLEEEIKYLKGEI